MAQAPSESSGQNAVLITFDSPLPAGTLIHIQAKDGEDLLTFAPVKNFQSVVFSSPELTEGEDYMVFVGGSTTGTNTNGLFEDGAYTAGTPTADFTVTGKVRAFPKSE
jgi:hypothetical protein